ncbi:hypothetical protein NQ317_000233 [Molorchus minor]|uniref:Uncharacterized protein n=1 Tax=Molorchus minor TaxID=1323400 RepID=A0ABQ9JST7_9CUCU|nr:hypothetical protein NQ317_000233 [Molorchus minor]
MNFPEVKRLMIAIIFLLNKKKLLKSCLFLWIVNLNSANPLFSDEECQEILQQQQKHKNSGSSAEMVYTKTSAVACFNEAIPAASLSNTLKLQSRSSSILSLLSASSCKNQGSKLLASHALSLDVLLSKGLELGCHSAACWPHVFSACVAVASLEHCLFSKTGSTQLLMVAQNTQNNIVTSTTCSNPQEKLHMSFNITSDEETW